MPGPLHGPARASSLATTSSLASGCHNWPSTGVVTRTSAFCPRLTQQVVHQHDGHHRFGNRRGADADARVVTALGDDVHRVAMHVDRTARRGDARGRLQRQMRNDRLAGGNTTEDAARVVAEETLRGQFVAMLGAALGDTGETGADFHAFDRVDAHQRVGQFGVEAVEDRLAQARLYTFGHHGDLRADRVLVAAQLVHVGFQFRHLVRVGAEEGVVVDAESQVLNGISIGPSWLM